MAKLSIVVSIVLLALFVKDAEPLRCWSCSSDLSSPCNDPMDVKAKTDNDYLFGLKECSASINNSSKSVCYKQKKPVDGKTVIIRGCSWKKTDDKSTTCPSSLTKPNETLTFCETCDSEGCNGAATIGRTLALLVAPLGLLLFKLF